MEELALDDGEDELEIYGGQMDTSQRRPSVSAGSSDMSLDEFVASPPIAQPPPSPRSSSPVLDHPPPPDSPPPPPPPDGLPPPPPPPRSPIPTPPMVRWARFNTDLFDSDRLMAFTTARPLPLGS